jgi:hypothetical protein
VSAPPPERLPGTFPGGYKHPPAHPNCRCVLVAWRPEWDEDGPGAPIGAPASRDDAPDPSVVGRKPTGRSVTDPDEVSVPHSANPEHEMFRNDPRGRAGAERFKALIEFEHTLDEMVSGVVDHAVAMADDDDDAFRGDGLGVFKHGVGDYHGALGKKKGTGLTAKEFKERAVAEYQRRAEEYRARNPSRVEEDDEDED